MKNRKAIEASIRKRFFKSSVLVCSVLMAPALVVGQKITAEMVLGDYRSDPLFGQAAPERTIPVIIELNRLVPSQVNVESGKTVRILITNESQQPHLIVATDNVDRVLANEAYILSFHDESAARLSPAGTHTHSGGSSVQDASPIVRTASEDPALYISPGNSREMLIKILPAERIDLFCVLDEHHLHGFQTRMMIEGE